MESENSLPCSQEPAATSYTELDASIPYFTILFP